MTPKFFSFLLGASLCITCSAGSVWAATQPDAGKTLQDLKSQPSAPKPAPNVSVETPSKTQQKPGGTKVTLKSIELNGNTVFTKDQLLKLLEGAQGQSFDLAGLNELADRITNYYHRHDYPFARAIIPEQSLKNSTLKIEIVEGRYGAVTINSADAQSKKAIGFLHKLRSGNIIKGKPLERSTLILNDLPGYSFVPVVRPGQDVGTGDLSLLMQRNKRFGGSVHVDNYGNRYTGMRRENADLYANSALLFGDQATLSAVYTDEDMWLGSAGYSLPLGRSGLRGNIGYGHVDYQLAQQFTSLDAHGVADVVSGGVSYPLIRSQKTNLAISGTYQHKWLSDEQGSSGTNDKKSSDVLPIALNFDKRDNMFGGGITYGALSWTHGVLDLHDGLAVTDSTTADSNGNFDKFNLDAARLQALPINNTVWFTRLSGQLAAKNLDSSEDFGLGGPYGVRAYPVGEGYGDEGILTQNELRYTFGHFTPYGFFDFGYTKINHDPWTTGDNQRSVGGGGVGLRLHCKDWSADGSVAWRTVGGDPESDDKDRTPQIWVNIGYNF